MMAASSPGNFTFTLIKPTILSVNINTTVTDSFLGVSIPTTKWDSCILDVCDRSSCFSYKLVYDTLSFHKYWTISRKLSKRIETLDRKEFAMLIQNMLNNDHSEEIKHNINLHLSHTNFSDSKFKKYFTQFDDGDGLIDFDMYFKTTLGGLFNDQCVKNFPVIYTYLMKQ